MDIQEKINDKLMQLHDLDCKIKDMRKERNSLCDTIENVLKPLDLRVITCDNCCSRGVTLQQVCNKCSGTGYKIAEKPDANELF